MSFRCSISIVSIYYWPESDIRAKSNGRLNFPCASLFNFERLDILWGWIKHPSEKLWPFKFAESFRCSISSVSIYYWPNPTSESKVVAVWICLVLWCLISSVSIYYGPESNIRVKSYDHMSLPRASVVQFQVLDILLAWIVHLSQKLWLLEFAIRFDV